MYEFAKIRLDVTLIAKYGSVKVGTMAVARILVRERTLFGVGLVGVRGPIPPPPTRPREFAKNFTEKLKKIAKNALF